MYGWVVMDWNRYVFLLDDVLSVGVNVGLGLGGVGRQGVVDTCMLRCVGYK